MEEDAGTSASLSNSNDPGQNFIVQGNPNSDQRPVASVEVVPYRPGISSIVELIQHQPTELFSRIQALENRVAELTELNENLERENTRLHALTGENRWTNIDSVPEESVSFLQVSYSGTSVHGVTRRPRFGFPSVPSMSLRDVSSSTQFVEPPSSPTAASSPAVTVMFVRRGVEIGTPQHSCASSSSHQVVILQRPAFHDDTQVSDTSISDREDSLPTSDTGIATSHSASLIDEPFQVNRRIVTYSLPHLAMVPSLNNFIDNLEDELGYDNQTELHHSHSWPPIRPPVLEDFSMALSRYLEEHTDSEFDLDDSDEDDDQFEEVESRSHSMGSLPPPETANTTGVQGQVEENESAPENEEELAPTATTRERENQPLITGVRMVEHPFLEPLRNIHEEIVLTRMFGSINTINSPTVPSALYLSRRRGITIMPTRETGASSWARSLRAQIFLNVNLGTAPENNQVVDLDDNDTESTDSIDSMNNVGSDMSINALDEHEEGDGEQIEVDENNVDVVDAELEEVPVAPEDAGDNSSDDSGQGDAESVVSSSSTTSLSSHASETAGGQVPPPVVSFPYPSESNLGGKYGYLKAAIRRPRAPDGHRFVVSVFGTAGRKFNETNLPTWVPVYAERLECILNQFLDRSDSNHQNGVPVVQILHNNHETTNQSQSNHNKNSSNSNMSQKVSMKEPERSDRPGQLKSSKEGGSTGKESPSSFSSSHKMSVRSQDPIVSSNTENSHDIPTASAENKQQPSTRTKSCPDVLLECVKNIGTEVNAGENEPQNENSTTNKGTKKKGFARRAFGKFCCNCNKGLKKSSSHDCIRPKR